MWLKRKLNTKSLAYNVDEGCKSFTNLTPHSTSVPVHLVLSNVTLRSYYPASSAVRSCPWAGRTRCCLATQPRCPGSWQSRPCRHCSHHWRHWAGSPLCCAGTCCWWACSWPTCTWRDLGRKEDGGREGCRGWWERKQRVSRVSGVYWYNRCLLTGGGGDADKDD